PENNVYFHYGDLKLGAEIPIYFSRKDPSRRSRFLSREESDAIPFSAGKISEILEFFGIPADSPRAAAVNATLRHCEAGALPGETKFCVSTLESLLDSVVRTFGGSSSGRLLRTLTTDLVSSERIPLLQNYTVIRPPTAIATEMVVGCHVMPYPYAVLYCHAQAGDTAAYKVNLVGSDGGHVDAAAVCHMDTSRWDPLHVAFRVLKMSPGESPACHFFPGHDLVWV
ncbi:hypothetical protein M569_08548, partial [Genlisea aurea]